MGDWTDLVLRDRCVAAVRAEISRMRPEMLIEMAHDTGPTDLTPFAIIALAVLEVAANPTVGCDPEIAPLVAALNLAGLKTIASCSGHGHRPGNIALSDGREIIIARNFEEARQIGRLFPLDIHGNLIQCAAP